MNKQPITTLLFDFDGTLLDTNDLIIQTFLSVLGNRYPGRFTKEDCLHFIGPSLKQTFDSIDETLTDELIQEYQDCVFEASYWKMCSNCLQSSKNQTHW